MDDFAWSCYFVSWLLVCWDGFMVEAGLLVRTIRWLVIRVRAVQIEKGNGGNHIYTLYN